MVIPIMQPATMSRETSRRFMEKNCMGSFSVKVYQERGGRCQEVYPLVSGVRGMEA